MGADAVTGFDQFADTFRIALRHAADREEGRFHALRGENSENLVAVARQRSVVERQHHLMVAQRQGFWILHAADAGMFARIDHQSTRRAERIWMAGTLGR